MKPETILKKAIEKAVRNGWDLAITTDDLIATWNRTAIIFRHDFAQAFWGKKDVCRECGEDKHEGGFWHLPNWVHHLQQMVLEKDPIKYLEKFL